MKSLLAKKVKKNNKGFTLVELIIVIAIIAILVAVLAPNYVKYVDRSRWSSDRNDCASLLSEIKTGIIDVQNDGKSVKSFTINVTSSGIDDPSLSGNTDLVTELSSADAHWTDVKVKHKNPQSLPGETTTKAYTTFSITYAESSGKVNSEWK